MAMNLIKKWKARQAGVPFRYDKFWPAYYILFDGPTPKEMKVLKEVYDAKVGDIVPIFTDGSVNYMYKLLVISRAPGSDHIVSPLQFHITYDGTATI